MSKITVIGIAGQTIFMELERFHREGETLETDKAHFEYGAKGFNQALACARMGASVSFVCPVADDIYNDIEALCRNEGIKPCLAKKHGISSFGCVLTDAEGANRVTVYKGVNLNAEDILSFENEIKDSDILLLNNEINEDANLSALRLAKKHGVKVILNPAPCRKIHEELLCDVFLFTPNESETQGLEKCRNVIETLGKNGCYIRSEGIRIPAKNVNAIDTTGAGDTFNGVLASELASGKDIIAAARTAVTASGISVTRKGAAASIPFKAEILKESLPR